MRKLLMVPVAIALMFSVSRCSSPAQTRAQDDKAVLEAAARAMGATTLNSIQYSGTGVAYGMAQARLPETPPPAFNAKVTVAINYQTPAMRNELMRSQLEDPPRGGAGQPMIGEQGYAQYVSGKHAWSETSNNPNPEGPGGAQPGAVRGRLREIWKTPHGVIKAAIVNGAQVNGSVISFETEGEKIRATLNDESLVERVETWVDNSVLGDMLVEKIYRDYADFEGVKFPKRIIERQDEALTLDIAVHEVKPNASVSLEVPANVVQAPPPGPMKVDTTQIADGVWTLTAANSSNLAIAFKDHVVVFEASGNEARSIAVIKAIGELIPGKPIKYVVNTHYHFEHAGGLRAYVAEGATVITHETNKAFFERVWARPRTVSPDALAKSPRKPIFETVSEKKVLTDGSQTLEVHHVRGNSHNEGMLIGYLPKAKMVAQADMYYPPTVGDDPRDLSRQTTNSRNLYDNIQRLKLDATQLVNVHGGLRPMGNLRKAIGILPPT